MLKTKLIGEGCSVPIITLLNTGMDIYENKISTSDLDLDIDEKIEVEKIKRIIDYYIDGFFNPNDFLCKDSTASVFQHLFRFLPPKDLEALVLCNLAHSNH